MPGGLPATSTRCASARGCCAQWPKRAGPIPLGLPPSNSSWPSRASRSRRRGEPPILLLDEIAAHLDAARREALFELLAGLESQAWLTGTDAALFQPLRQTARFLSVADGTLCDTPPIT